MADGVCLLLERVRLAHIAEMETLQQQVEALRAALNEPFVDCEDECQNGVSKEVDQPNESVTFAAQMRCMDSVLSKRVSQISENSSNSSGRRHSRNSASSILMFSFQKGRTSSGGSYYARFRRFVNGPVFESFFSCLIFINAMIMALEVQYNSFDIEAMLDGRGLDAGVAKMVWPGAERAFDIVSWIFGVMFTLEVTLKLLATRTRFIYELWNWIDSTIVAIWIISRAGTQVVPVNGQIFRLFRLVRLVRLLRLVRTIQTFDALYLMTTALRGSVSILTWAAILLLVLQMLLALLFTQLLTQYFFTNDSVGVEEKKRVYTYFGSFSRSLLSMFEITLANWPPVCRVLMENVSEGFIVFSILHKLTIGFAVVGVINGVFMQETFKVASTDDRIMLRQKQHAGIVHAEKMRRLFNAVDCEHRGYISFDQFRVVMSDPHVKTWLASMELSTDDVDKLYGLLDDGDQRLEADELIKGVARLKGTARSIDLAILMQDMQRLLHYTERLSLKVEEQVITNSEHTAELGRRNL